MTPKTVRYYEELLKKEYPKLLEYRACKKKAMIKNIVIYELAFALIAYGTYDYIVRNVEFWGDTSIILKGIIVGILAAIIPPLLFKRTVDLMEATWVGTIESIKYEIRYPQTKAYTTKPRLGNGQEFIKMKLKTDKGKKKTFACHSHMSQVFKKGDRIVKFRGFPFPAEDSENENKFICIVCGNVVNSNRDECPKCNLPIVKLHQAAEPKNIWEQFEYTAF